MHPILAMCTHYAHPLCATCTPYQLHAPTTQPLMCYVLPLCAMPTPYQLYAALISYVYPLYACWQLNQLDMTYTVLKYSNTKSQFLIVRAKYVAIS